MQIQQLKDIGIVTEQLAASRDFYERLLGFEAVFVSEWYVHLKNGPVELGLMTPRETFAAVPAGAVWVSVGVASADAEYERLAAAGARLDGMPEDRPWGERCFVVRDPNGMGINLSQTIAMDEAFMRTQNHLTHAAG